MQVRMLIDISGTRNGVVWPRRGQLSTELPEDEALDLIRSGAAEPVDDKPPVESAAEDTKPKAKSTRSSGLTKAAMEDATVPTRTAKRG